VLWIEFGGANGSIACVKKGYKADFAIIAEPTSMDICISNVSSKVVNIKISGDTGLKYLGSGIESTNSILLAKKLIDVLEDYENYLNSLKDKFGIFNKLYKPIRFLFSDIKAGEIGLDKIVTTPSECLLRVYLMNYPEIDKEEFNNMMFSFMKRYPDIYKYIENGSITFNDEYRFIEGGIFDIDIERNKEFISKIVRNGIELTDQKLKTSAMLGGTDFFAFSNYGNTPVIVLGPGGGNCHAANEYVNLDDLLQLSKIYGGLIYDYCC